MILGVILSEGVRQGNYWSQFSWLKGYLRHETVNDKTRKVPRKMGCLFIPIIHKKYENQSGDSCKLLQLCS